MANRRKPFGLLGAASVVVPSVYDVRPRLLGLDENVEMMNNQVAKIWIDSAFH
jgi:hypothetical protein